VNCRQVLFAILIVVTLAGCQYDPWAHRFLTRQPAEQDVVGLYAVDQASLQRTIKRPMNGSMLNINPSAHIILSADHKAAFFYVPRDLDGLSCSVTGRGTWQLGRNGSYVTVWAQIADEESNNRCKDTFTAKYAEELMLYGTNVPYKLHVTIGDPDSGDAVQFERRN
jgi:hypothetical protein